MRADVLGATSHRSARRKVRLRKALPASTCSRRRRPHIAGLQQGGKRVIVGCWTEGSADRMGGVLADHGVTALKRIADWREANGLHKSAVGLAVLGIEHGFEGPDFAVLTEQDVLGDRMVRSRGRQRRSQNFLSEASALTPGDLVTHIEHGIGRYLGLKAIEVQGEPHDCLELQYDGGKLFLPVENIELLTRFGSEESGVQLDRLGGVGWQSRKARMKQRVREMAAELIRIAAGARHEGDCRQRTRPPGCTTNSAPASPMPRPRIRKRRLPM
jgi:transcription-repair coupling factor (superfamily II helicase)